MGQREFPTVPFREQLKYKKRQKRQVSKPRASKEGGALKDFKR